MAAPRARVLRWVAVAAAAPAVLAVLFIAYFVARAEIAHEIERCPFHVVARRAVSGAIAVVDEGRRCQPGVVEHRWLVDRGGSLNEIGRRRLHDPYYDAGRYRFVASLREGQVHVDIQNDGVEPAHFQEAPPVAR